MEKNGSSPSDALLTGTLSISNGTSAMALPSLSTRPGPGRAALASPASSAPGIAATAVASSASGVASPAGAAGAAAGSLPGSGAAPQADRIIASAHAAARFPLRIPLAPVRAEGARLQHDVAQLRSPTPRFSSQSPSAPNTTTKTSISAY